MTDEEALRRAILENPGDDTVRLVYADWLDENNSEGDCPDCDGRGEVRFCDAAGDMDDEPCRKCGGSLAGWYKRGTGRASNGYAFWAEFIRVQITLANPIKCRACGGTGRLDADHRPGTIECRACDPWGSGISDQSLLKTRERELCFQVLPMFEKALGPLWTGHGQSQHLRCDQHTSFMLERQYIVRRGFLDELHLPAEDWLLRCDQITWHPTQTTECPACDGYWYDRDCARCKCPTCSGSGTIRIGFGGAHGYGPPVDCPSCGGSRRKYPSRPMPATAQPIRRVTLTTPIDFYSGPHSNLIHLGPADLSGNVLRQRTCRSARYGCWWSKEPPAIKHVLALEWPLIEFTLAEQLA